MLNKNADFPLTLVMQNFYLRPIGSGMQDGLGKMPQRLSGALPDYDSVGCNSGAGTECLRFSFSTMIWLGNLVAVGLQ